MNETMSILDTLEKKFGWFTFPYLLPILLVGQVMVYLAVVSEQISPGFLPLSAERLLMGEYWRVFTFMLYPMQWNPLFFALFVSITYIMGSALEREWGEFRFGLFIGCGWLATLAVSFLVPYAYLDNMYLFGSLVMAFAWMFPDFEIRWFMIIPIKVKYIGYVYWAMYALELIGGHRASRLSVLAALLPFVLFFGKDILGFFKQKKRAAVFKKVTQKELGTPFHQCETCGKNDLKNPEIDFRYNQGHCYCEACLQQRNAS